MSVRVIATVPAGYGDEELELWQLTGLSRGDVPEWFQEIVDTEYGGSFNPDWYDHVSRDEDTLVVEPYDLSDESLRDLVAFADKHSLRIHISAIASHYPTRTLSIALDAREAA
jgi:hypothetical protein